MDTMEIIYTIAGVAVVIISVVGLYSNILQRLTKVETCIDPNTKKIDEIDKKIDDIIDNANRQENSLGIVLAWIECLNGEVSSKEFLEKLKEVTQRNYPKK